MRLNYKISITTYVNVYDTDTGGETKTGTSVTWWANVKQLSESDVLNFGMDQANKNYAIIMRSMDLNVDSTITYDSKILRVNSVSDYSQEGKLIRVLAVEDGN